jgi:hypothetical protein
MWQGPHAWSVKDDCTGVALGVFSYARLESRDRRLCVCGLRMVTPWWSLSGHSVLQRVADLAWHNVGDDGAVLGGLLSGGVSDV